MEFLIKTKGGQQVSSKSLDSALRDSGLHSAGGRLTKAQALSRIKSNDAELYIRKNHLEGWRAVEQLGDFEQSWETKGDALPDDGKSKPEVKSTSTKSASPKSTIEELRDESKSKSKSERIEELERELKEQQGIHSTAEEKAVDAHDELEESKRRKKKLEDIDLWDDESMKTARQSIEESIDDAETDKEEAEQLITESGVRIHEIEKELDELQGVEDEQSEVQVGTRVDHPLQDVLIRRCRAVQAAHKSSQDALYPMLVGPAGSGKTTAARNVSIALFGESSIEDGKFGMMSLNEESERSEGFGFISPIDRVYKSTDFRKIYEYGGVFLLDEVDAANANTLTALNAAISAPYASFPDKVVKRHQDFILIAAANTFGNGADGLYVGRNELDAATRDRFLTMVWNYDWDGIRAARPGHTALVSLIQKLSDAAISLEMQHIISPRAALFAPFMIAQGDSVKDALDSCVFKGLPKDDIDTLLTKVGLSVSELETI
jgi:MoxR-like ATPase